MGDQEFIAWLESQAASALPEWQRRDYLRRARRAGVNRIFAAVAYVAAANLELARLRIQTSKVRNSEERAQARALGRLK